MDDGKSVSMRQPAMTLEEFLDWEERQELRYELDGFEPRAMMGGTIIHARIASNLAGALRGRLRPPCFAVGSDARLRLARTVRYPDAMVICSPVPRDATWVTAPTIVFEVLSSSTARVDRIEKNREYQAALSIQRYVLLEQSSIAAEVYARDGERWVRSTVTGDETLHLPEIGTEFALSEIYAGIELEGSQAEGD